MTEISKLILQKSFQIPKYFVTLNDSLNSYKISWTLSLPYIWWCRRLGVKCSFWFIMQFKCVILGVSHTHQDFHSVKNDQNLIILLIQTVFNMFWYLYELVLIVHLEAKLLFRIYYYSNKYNRRGYIYKTWIPTSYISLIKFVNLKKN